MLTLNAHIQTITKTRFWYIFKKIIPVFIIWSTFIVMVSIIDYRTSCHEAFCNNQSIYNIPQNTAMPWDGGWYLSVVDGSYQYSPVEVKEFNVAFFPVAPMVYRLFKFISLNNSNLYLAISITFNVLLFLLSLVFVLRIVEALINDNLKDSWLLLLSMLAIWLPSNFFMSTIYADSILTFCLSACLFFAIKRNMFKAAIFAGLASGTKAIGLAGSVILLSVLVLDLIGSKLKFIEFFKKNLLHFAVMIIISLSGIIGYSTYLKIRFNEPLAFFKVQKAWQRNTNNNILNSAKKLVKTNVIGLMSPAKLPEANIDSNSENKLDEGFVRKSKIFYAVFNTVNFIAVVASTLVIFAIGVKSKSNKQRGNFLILSSFLFTMWAIPASTGTLWSMNRYLILPSMLVTTLMAYTYLNKFFSSNKRQLKHKMHHLALMLLVVLLALIQFLLFWLFLNWVFVG